MANNSMEISPAPRVYRVMATFLTILSLFLLVKTFQMAGLLDSNPYPREMSIEATGSALVTPDTARMSFGVTSTGPDSKAVTEANTTTMNAVIEALKAEGVDAKDIKTDSYSLSPRYEYTEAAGSVQNGYDVSQMVTVETKDLSKVGTLIAKATAAGATNVSSVQFIIKDPEAAKDEARKDALEQLKAKTKSISELSGIRFGRVVNYYEYTVQDAYPMDKGMYMEGATSDMMLNVPSVEAGQSEVKVSVSLTYRVK